MTELPAPSWTEFNTLWQKIWKQGEHVFISAQTGAGKTELETKLIRRRDWSVIFCTKPGDPIFKSPQVRDYHRMEKWQPGPHTNRILLGPRAAKSTRELQEKQLECFAEAIDAIYKAKGWAVAFDELAHMSEFMGRSVVEAIKMLHHVGRAYGISVISATQRPSRIPLIVPSSASHAFIGKTSNPDDIKRVVNISPWPAQARAAIAGLKGKHDFVYLNAEGDQPIQVVNTRRL
jgi:hypothetical protein